MGWGGGGQFGGEAGSAQVQGKKEKREKKKSLYWR
jgi:hypothetical protein